MAITDPALRKAKWSGTDRWLTDRGSRGGGRLRAKITQDEVLFYFAYYLEGDRRHWPMGPYASKGDHGGITLAEARDKAGEHSRLYRSGVRDLHAHYERERREEDAHHKAADAERQREEQLAKSGSLRLLLEAYYGHLERAGKQSFRDVRNSFKRNVFDEFPNLCEKRASEVTPDELVAVVARVVSAGHGRDAAKLRSHLSAAYSMAIDSALDPTLHNDVRAMGIKTNPAAAIPTKSLAKFNRARERALSANELRHYWRCVRGLPESPTRDALMFGMLIGGQRPMQLLRVTTADIDLVGRTVTIHDTKGKRQQPRLHVLPLTERTAAILHHRIDGAATVKQALPEAVVKNPSIFTSDGKRQTNHSTVSHVATEISVAMVEKGETGQGFQLRDVRRTCETMFAKMGVSKDIRAQVLSHGLSGVQDRHYDQHGYMDEKRAALEAWERLLEVVESDVPLEPWKDLLGVIASGGALDAWQRKLKKITNDANSDGSQAKVVSIKKRRNAA